MCVGAGEAVSKPGTILGIGTGIGIGIGIGFYECHSKQELIFFDPDSDPDSDPDVHGVSSTMHKSGKQKIVLRQHLKPRPTCLFFRCMSFSYRLSKFLSCRNHRRWAVLLRSTSPKRERRQQNRSPA
jgi:hypothetical protein